MAGLSLFISGILYETYLLPGRGLTPAEDGALRDIFGKALDRGRIRIHASKAADRLLVRPFGGSAIAHARGDTIVMLTRHAVADHMGGEGDAREKNARAALLVHEAAHVWQSQNCPFRAGAVSLRQAFMNIGRTRDEEYKYRLEEGKDLLDYPLEQQAGILEDFHVSLKRGFVPNDLLNTERGEALERLYRGVLKNFHADPSYIARNCRRL